MSTRLKSLMKAVRDLSPGEQLELIRAVTQLLDLACHRDSFAEDFWALKSLDEIEQHQSAAIVSNVADLAADFWPEDESADGLIDYIYLQRREDRLEDS